MRCRTGPFPVVPRLVAVMAPVVVMVVAPVVLARVVAVMMLVVVMAPHTRSAMTMG